MLEELQRRNYSDDTIRHHLRSVTEFAEHFGKPPDKLGLDELRSYQVYLLKERKLAPGSVVNHVAGLRFFFVKTLKRYEFRDFLPYPERAAAAAHRAQPGGGRAADQRQRDIVPASIVDDAVRHRDAAQRGSSSEESATSTASA